MDKSVVSLEPKARLCLGMASYNDFDGVWFSIEAIRLYQPEVLDKISFLIVDNNPAGQQGDHLRSLASEVPGCRYVPFNGYCGTSVKDIVFREADAEIVCCIDSHILMMPGSLKAIIDWHDENPDSPDLLQGPLLSEHREFGTTHMEPKWSGGMFGRWSPICFIPAYGKSPFEIDMQGLGLFACRKDAWPGLNPRLRGFSGDEGYLHEKFRRAGGRVLCHPQLGWRHRFRRQSAPYPNSWDDRIRNYVIAWSELDWDLRPVYDHFAEHLNYDAKVLFDKTTTELKSPLYYFDGIFCLLEGLCESHSHPVTVSRRVELISEMDSKLNHEHDQLLRWRTAIMKAQRRAYEHILLLLDDSVEATRTLGSIEIADLASSPWTNRVFYFVPDTSGETKPAVVAVALHASQYDRLLLEIPADLRSQKEFLSKWGSVEAYACESFSRSARLAGPQATGFRTVLNRRALVLLGATGLMSLSACPTTTKTTTTTTASPFGRQDEEGGGRQYKEGGDPLPTPSPPESPPATNDRGIGPPTTTTTISPFGRQDIGYVPMPTDNE